MPTKETLGPTDSQWLGQYSQVHMNVFGTPLRVMDHGEGVRIWDVDGNEYLDFLAGIAVNSLGYAHPAWVKAVSEQAAKCAHVSNYFATEPQIRLASRLIELAGAPEGSHVYFGNSGAEGNEAALKLAKLYGRTLPGASPSIGGKPARILALTHGFHGRTMGALSATWKPVIRKPFEPLVPNIEFVRAGDPIAMYEAFSATGLGQYGKGPVAAVILELIQGEAGVRPLDVAYVKKVRELCDINHALLIIDEVQTGIGRTGSWFAFQREDLAGGITPDIVTFAKGVAGGFPMGGMISFGGKLSALFTPGSHGSTFAGNPLGAAAALATLDTIENEHLVENAEERGEQLRQGIMASGNPLFTSVRGRGLLNAILLSHRCSHAAMNWALEHGLIVNAVAPDALRLAPPLIVSEQEIDEAVSILAKIPADLLTIAQHRGGVDALPGKTIAYLGDSANNMANSYLLSGATAGMNVRIAGPFGYLPDPAIVADAERIAAENGGSILVTTDPREAVADADCIFTDTWVSMGEEAEYAIRSKPFWDYQVNDELMALAKPDALFQHCLPAYRGKEVTASVIDGPQSVVWDEAENRLHAQKALLTWLIGQQRGDESLLA